jgi:hypothetical protein
MTTMKRHPSGRPVRSHTVKSATRPSGTCPGFYNARLNEKPQNELPGGFGFRMPEAQWDEGNMWAKVKP